MFTRKGSLALFSLACASAWSFGAIADTTSFELGSYVNWPGGTEIAAHDYAGAIKSASSVRGYADITDALIAATNLCVAQTATGAFPEARAACDRAVELAQREDAMASIRFPTEAASSRALSNRGVLRALDGDVVGAARDFRAAAKVRAPWAAAERNLVYLETSPTYRVALADAGAK